MEPIAKPFSRNELVDLLEKGAFRRYHVNKLLKAYEGKGKPGKYQNCQLSYEDSVIRVSGIFEEKDFIVSLASIKKRHHVSFIKRARYSLKGIRYQQSYRVRLERLSRDLMTRKLASSRKNRSPRGVQGNPQNQIMKKPLVRTNSKAKQLVRRIIRSDVRKNQNIQQARHAKRLQLLLNVHAVAKEHAEKVIKESSDQALKQKASHLLAMIYLKEGHFSKALSYAACFDGIPMLREFYEQGKGNTKELEIAIQTCIMKAKLGNALSQYHLGSLYYYGIGKPLNIEKAIYYYKLAADQGCDIAIQTLENMSQTESMPE